MTKQEKIQEAYGEHWDKVKDFVDKNGWVEFTWTGRESWRGVSHSFLNISDELIDRADHYGTGNYKWRLKSLNGLENNNGWIKIESEADLPKKEYETFLIYTSKTKTQAVDVFYKNKAGWWMEKVTHYQPIISPLLPVY